LLVWLQQLITIWAKLHLLLPGVVSMQRIHFNRDINNMLMLSKKIQDFKEFLVLLIERNLNIFFEK